MLPTAGATLYTRQFSTRSVLQDNKYKRQSTMIISLAIKLLPKNKSRQFKKFCAAFIVQ